LAVTGADGRIYRIQTSSNGQGPLEAAYASHGLVPTREGGTARLVALPAARLVGRVTTKLPGLNVGGLWVWYQDSHKSGQLDLSKNLRSDTVTDTSGRFTFDHLDEGTVNVFVDEPAPDAPWTYRAATDVALEYGKTSEVTVELIRGVEVSGTVVARDTGTPVAGAWVAVKGPYRPHSGAAQKSWSTDTRGRFHHRLPPGETEFSVRWPGQGTLRTVTIPESVSEITLAPLEIRLPAALHGTLVDARGNPVKATVVGVCPESPCALPAGVTPAGASNERGEFRLSGPYHTATPGRRATMLVRLANGQEFEVTVEPAVDGTVRVQLPVALDESPAKSESK
jgi:hypothetical protein